MEERNISRRTLLAAAVGTVGTAAPRQTTVMIAGLGMPHAYHDDAPEDASAKTDGVLPRIYASLHGVYDVKDYGATGDGVTDDAPAIRAAISAVPTQGGIVY